MARSAALNPTSTPFFPGSAMFGDDESGGGGLGFMIPSLGHAAGGHEQDRASVSSVSISPSEYRSIRSSPSPPQDAQDRARARAEPRFNAEPTINGKGGNIRASPALRNVNADKAYPAIETRTVREMSMAGTVESLLDEGPDTPGPTANGRSFPRAGGEAFRDPFLSGILDRSRERLHTPPVAPSTSSRSSSFTNPAPFVSASPESSLESASQYASAMDHLTVTSGFDAQLKASPFMHDLLDRLVRAEYTTREVQRELSEVHRKVNLLLERALAQPSGLGGAPPEFKDPFSPTLHSGQSMAPRASFSAGIAPNQSAPSDDMRSITQRLNTLTSSVGQLLALQTQQHAQGGGPSGFSNTPPLGSGFPPQEIPPNQMLSASNQALLGNGLPTRSPVPRAPNPPMRTWSAGSLDFPVRHASMGDAPGTLGRQDGLLRDKQRRSVLGIMRRDSAGPGDNWPGPAGSPREGGPTLTKWEQLPLSPDLLRSLSKFGVGPPNKIQQRALPFLLRGADIIAQAPPTQERIAAYVIPAIQVVLSNLADRPVIRGPVVVMVSTTVDQATQAQRMIRDLGGLIGVRSALGVGAAGGDISQELRLLQQNMPHIICGTPQKLHALFTTPGGLQGSEVRFLVLDEVDQLIARNLHEFVFSIVKLFPPPRSRSAPANGNAQGLGPSFDGNVGSSLGPQARRASYMGIPDASEGLQKGDRQTALFSNTVPQDVLNLAQAIQLREPVRVLVRRDGNVTQSDSNQGARGLRQFYLYLAFTAGGRPDAAAGAAPGGLGIIGSGRGSTSAETTQAREWKLDALADLFDDVDVPQAIVHVGGMTALDAVVYKLASKGLEAVPLHGDMNASAKVTAINKFRTPPNMMRTPAAKVLVVYDVQVKSAEVSQIPLVVNYDLPKAVEEYAHRVAPAIAPNYARAGVVINFVTATGGDVEMLRSIECFYKIKCPEVPMSLRDVI